MSWDDRDYSNQDEPEKFFGRPGGDWQGVRPSFDNPMSWSIFMGRVSGITVRVHVIFLLFIIIMLGQSLWQYMSQDQPIALTVGATAVMLASLFVIVLIHEFGHCMACRWSGGSANEILMWPLGGLAYCRPRHHWKAHFITVVGGPMVNVVFFFIVGAMIWILTKRFLGVVLLNPFEPFAAMHIPAINRSLALQALYLFHAVNVLLLLFNLLPLFPMDGGRIVQALLWPRFGYGHSMRLAVRTGYIGAIIMGIVGIVSGAMMLVLIAVFGGLTCWQTHKQLQFTEDFMGFEDDQFMLDQFDRHGKADAKNKPSARQQKRAEREQKREEEELAEVDRILQKIADSGMDSLSGREKKLLQTVTDRKRKSE